ncbi:uncharacterized protein [Spinacia oleracea]|uniref:Uncharacterized protein n=1 Tax=Spinacia oleracea TaxID=3562 RepID=A0ABM3RV37_SPIOL|nr:uncharacterized protein LOC130472458 [Spinacia oleracea]
MSRLSPEDKGLVDVPTWLSLVYTDDIFKAVEAKKKDSTKKSDEGASGDASKEPTSSATKKRPASSAATPKPKRSFFKKLGTADATAKSSVSKPSAPLAGGEGAPIPQATNLPPKSKETSPKVAVDGDSVAEAAATEAATDKVDVPGAAAPGYRFLVEREEGQGVPRSSCWGRINVSAGW